MDANLLLAVRNVTILIASAILLDGCIYDQFNHTISVVNKSNRTISVLYDNDEKSDSNENYIAYYTSDYQIIKPDSTWNMVKPGGENAWHDYIQEAEPKKLFIYVFDLDTLRKYDSADLVRNVRDEHKYIEKMIFSEVELAKQNWKIVFKEK
jgi:hypothetical protein